jgi:integrase
MKLLPLSSPTSGANLFNVRPDATPTSDALNAVEAAAMQLLQAVRLARGFSVPSNNSPLNTARHVTVADLFNQFMLAKSRAGRSQSYVGLLLKELRSFATGREGQAVNAITAGEIEAWLHGQGWSARTKRGRLLTLRNVFAWAMLRGELVCNVALGVDLPTDDSENEPIEIHTPAQVREVLKIARAVDMNVCRCLAIRYFAGLRTSEAVALDECEIKEETIEVTAAKAKTRSRRIVTIQPNLRAWLNLGGVLPLRQVANRLTAVTSAVKLSGIPWPANVARHSFCSYHLAHFRSAAETALEAGHTEQMTFKHYRAIVTRDAAREFFSIFPD